MHPLEEKWAFQLTESNKKNFETSLNSDKISFIGHVFKINIYVSSQRFYNRAMKGFKQGIRPEKWNSSFPYETFQVLNIQR